MERRTFIQRTAASLLGTTLIPNSSQAKVPQKPNVLFIISDDLTATAISCYGNKTCQTPNIDRLAKRGTRFTRAYCQYPVCGPSRASLMNGYYPHASKVFGYVSGRKAIGKRATLPQQFQRAGYYTARVSKIYHMAIPRDIVKGSNGQDDPASWDERFNSQGPEWKAVGEGELLEKNPSGKKPVRGGNTFETIKAIGDDLDHSDGKTAAKASQLLKEHRQDNFFLAVGFVRPHVPFVAPADDFAPYPHAKIKLPPKIPGDWEDIPKMGINYKTSRNMQMNETQQRKGIAGYYASVSFMDRQVGKILASLKEEGLQDNTIVIFTSDHGYHLGEHDFWEKVSLHEESAKVPLIIAVPGQKPAVCNSFVELIDLYPTLLDLCGLEIPARIQGKSLSKMLADPQESVRNMAFCTSKHGRALMLRTERWAYIQYRENASGGIELFDMQKDPQQFNNLAKDPEYRSVVDLFRKRMKQKLKTIRENDLP